MKCITWTALIVLSVALEGRGAAARESITPRQVVEKALAAMGGREKLEALHTRTVVGRVDVLGGFGGKYEAWAKAPNKLKTFWNIGYIQQERAFDGSVGWEKNAAVRHLVGRDLARLRWAAIFDPLLNAAARDTRLILEGKRTIPGRELPFSPQMQLDTTGGKESNPLANRDASPQSREAYVIEVTSPGAETIELFVDAESFLPLRMVSRQPFEEGELPVTISYGDYRSVGAVKLPFAISYGWPDLPIKVRVDAYQLNVPVDDTVFVNPLASHAQDPYEITLVTLPKRLFKENDGLWSTGWQRFWGIPFPPTESWLFNLTVSEKYGRYLTPISATLEFYAGRQLIKTLSYSAEALGAMQKFPVARFAPIPEIFDLRHYGSEPVSPGMDRILYKLQLRAPDGRLLDASKEIRFSNYEQKSKLMFPIKGNFMVMNGHEFHELAHKYEGSQHYGYDIIGLGPDFELARHDGAKNEDFYAFAKCEILAPADGKVVYARNNDVPDDMKSGDYLKLPDPIYAIAGNVVIIDHGNSEFSLFAHMHQGSVRVKDGDKVKQGQVIGLMGSAGSPGVPHLHYQLQAGPGVFSSDGLPSQFENLVWVGWLGAREPIRVPKRGVYLRAE